MAVNSDCPITSTLLGNSPIELCNYNRKSFSLVKWIFDGTNNSNDCSIRVTRVLRRRGRTGAERGWSFFTRQTKLFPSGVGHVPLGSVEIKILPSICLCDCLPVLSV